jgi:2-polyprenyl-3-methyl-5-hydroxy-6-metoxy-1,4-benzoquinol methylase
VVNWLHSLFHDPHRGWDPIARDYAEEYERQVRVDPDLVRRFASANDGLKGRRIADVGSGPGHYACEFAKHGAAVTCIDVSASYLALADRRITNAGVVATFALGYMDSINDITPGGFDGIFSSVSWYYCMNDWSFASQLLRATRPGGVIMIRQTNETWDSNPSPIRKFVYWLNATSGIKIGHPAPPRGRIAAALERAGARTVLVDYTDPKVDVVTAIKAGATK